MDRATADTMMDTVLYALIFAAVVVGMVPVFHRVFAATPFAQSAQRYFESQLWQGQADSRTLWATDALQHIVLPTPWMGAFFMNDGPDAVKVWINDTASEPYLINPKETRTISHAGARDRIYAIHYQCQPGETAVVRVDGMY